MLGPEALRASVPPLRVPQITGRRVLAAEYWPQSTGRRVLAAEYCGGYLKGLAKLTPRSRHSLGNGTIKMVPLLSLRLGINRADTAVKLCGLCGYTARLPYT